METGITFRECDRAFKQRYEKTGFLAITKQRRRLAVQ